MLPSRDYWLNPVHRTLPWSVLGHLGPLNTWRPRQDGRYFPDNVFKCIFLNEYAWMSIKISLRFVPKGPINNIPALIQIMAWHRPGDKPLSEPMMVKLPTHICVTLPQWVNTWRPRQNSLHFPDDIFKHISLDENCCILMKISLQFVPHCPINNIPALVHIMAWRRPGDKPLSEPMMAKYDDAYMRHSASMS